MDELVESIVQTIADAKYWQDNLTDEERACLLNIARERLDAVMKAERVRLVNAFSQVNHALAGEGPQRANWFRDAVLAVGL